MKTLSVFLLLALSASAQPGRAGDRDDPFSSGIPSNVSPNAVLANGDPPLTESMVDAYNNLEAWLLEIPRTQQQRDGVRAMMIEDWKKPAAIKKYMSTLSMAAQIAQATLDQRSSSAATYSGRFSRVCERTRTIPMRRDS